MKTYRVTASINLRDDESYYKWKDEVIKVLCTTKAGCLVHLEIEPRDDERREVPVNRRRNGVRPTLTECA
jgi:hypothetical protein